MDELEFDGSWLRLVSGDAGEYVAMVFGEAVIVDEAVVLASPDATG